MEIGGYRTERLLGGGAAGTVWRATAPDGSLVALKVFGGPYQQALAAAKREAALAAQVDHPHLARIRDLICDTDQIALAIDLAAGGSLAGLLARRGRLTPPEVLTALIPIAAALATAHERGVVHGDLSPENIVFDAAGRPLLTDLGAARVAVECGLEVSATPGYVAPEVARGATPDPAADVFALGAVALHCLSGRPAWNADDLRDVVVQATVGQWPDPADQDGPAGLVAAIRSALGDTPKGRPGAAALMVELSRSGTPEPIRLTDPSAGDPTGLPTGSPTDADVSSSVISTSMGSAPSGFGSIRSVAQQRIRRIPTKVRADAVRPEPEQPNTGRWWERSGGRHAQAGRASGHRPTGGRDRRSLLRWAVIGTVMVIVGVLAVQAGLIWAGTGSRQGTLPPPSGAAERAVPLSASGRRSGPGTAPSTTAGAVAAPPAAAGTPRPAELPRSSDSSKPTLAPAPTSGPPARAGPGTAPTATAPTATARAAAAPPSAAAQWLDIVRRLDRARAAALVNRDAAGLDAVYTSTAPARTADGSTIARLTAEGLRVDGAAHRIVAVRVVRRGPAVTLEVTDSLPSYRVCDAQGEPVGTTGARGSGRRLLDLVRTPDGYRIAGVSTA
jgi:serine/threonine protein kinase